MKYEKERKFVKEVNEALKEEVIVSRIEILQVNLKKDRTIYEVIYKDRFGNKYMVDNSDFVIAPSKENERFINVAGIESRGFIFGAHRWEHIV